ncbi:MAG: hypothetical protein OEZ04_01910 [Nitrospinota bacterium]|nr:hypothetical protein [Nitrospinota bacterium]
MKPHKSRHALRYLIATFLLIPCLGAIYLSAYISQIGSYVKAEWWLKNVYDYKGYFADSIQQPKIIIIAGSNALFSVNSAVIEDITNIKTVNLASHAALDLSFHYNMALKYAKRGDILVLPLEFGYYTTDRRREEWFINNMLAWGWDDYLQRLSIADLVYFVYRTPKIRVLQGVINHGEPIPIPPKDRAITEVLESLDRNDPKMEIYSHVVLNRRGDINFSVKPTDNMLKMHKKGIPYFGNPSSIRKCTAKHKDMLGGYEKEI